MSILYGRTTDAQELDAAAWLVQEVGRLTNYPDMAAWPDDSLHDFTVKRHGKATCVWLATDSETGMLVGHGIAEPAGDGAWHEYPLTRDAYAAGLLVELGALAVHPHYQRQGIAKELRRQRLAWLDTQEYIMCAAAWANGPSDYMCLDDPEFVFLGTRLAQFTKQPVNDYVRIPPV